jgi:hypothetical protein
MLETPSLHKYKLEVPVPDNLRCTARGHILHVESGHQRIELRAGLSYVASEARVYEQVLNEITGDGICGMQYYLHNREWLQWISTRIGRERNAHFWE